MKRDNTIGNRFYFFLQGLAILTVLKIMFVNLKIDNFILMQNDKLVVVKKKKKKVKNDKFYHVAIISNTIEYF